ncbi:hypothetical protein BDB00DRAFT_788982 [Zychaea mexicana]|uniref:uncharacterized protein n=1 Tax=Zychaea mexicana TaxID=64656 RepID=UPI0022FDB9AA|nr:uncharacterized protein BDB00DRAFT_788982 [Zychaea mexicana]KAI9492207.1 hypothetical protein BDB00DRAFT_788982 [Zychaea mexicana]
MMADPRMAGNSPYYHRKNMPSPTSATMGAPGRMMNDNSKGMYHQYGSGAPPASPSGESSMRAKLLSREQELREEVARLRREEQELREQDQWIKQSILAVREKLRAVDRRL